MMTVKEARVLLSGRMQFGNPDHIEAVGLLETLSEALEAGVFSTYWVRKGPDLTEVKEAVVIRVCELCDGEREGPTCGERCPECGGAGMKEARVSADQFSKAELLKLLSLAAKGASFQL